MLGAGARLFHLYAGTVELLVTYTSHGVALLKLAFIAAQKGVCVVGERSEIRRLELFEGG